MEKIILSLLLFLAVSQSLSYAGDYTVIIKNGGEMAWSEYWEEAGHYCTNKSMGKICLNSEDVLKIEEKRADGTIVVIIENKLTEEDKRKNKEEKEAMEKRAKQEKEEMMAASEVQLQAAKKEDDKKIKQASSVCKQLSKEISGYGSSSFGSSYGSSSFGSSSVGTFYKSINWGKYIACMEEKGYVCNKEKNKVSCKD